MIGGYFTPEKNFGAFVVLAASIGLVLGGTQALSRSYFSQLIPRGREAEYFSLYQACERGTSWVGTLIFGLVHQWTDSYRPALLALILLFVLGLILLSRVNTVRGIREAGQRSSRRDLSLVTRYLPAISGILSTPLPLNRLRRPGSGYMSTRNPRHKTRTNPVSVLSTGINFFGRWLMAERTLRGARLGGQSFEDERGIEFAARQQVGYRCPQGHEFEITMSVEADIPATWECQRCGSEALSVAGIVPEVKNEKPARTHWDMLLERRSEKELEDILKERLDLLRGGEIGPAHLHRASRKKKVS